MKPEFLLGICQEFGKTQKNKEKPRKSQEKPGKAQGKGKAVYIYNASARYIYILYMTL